MLRYHGLSGFLVVANELAWIAKVGEVYAIGFDVSPEILTNLERGYVQLTSDQQPFLQGYMPILSLCGTWKYDLAPLNVDTGAGFVHTDNYKSLLKLAADGVR